MNYGRSSKAKKEEKEENTQMSAKLKEEW